MNTALSILNNIFLALYVIVFVVAIYKYPLYKDTALKFFPLILLFTLITEFLGKFIVAVYGPPNIIIYNIYYLLYFSFFFYIFMKSIEVERFKIYIKGGFGIFLLIYIRDLVGLNIVYKPFIFTYIAGAGILVFCILLYYISILQSRLVLVVKTDLLFWVSVGLFLFYIGYLPIKIIRTWFFKPDSFFEVLLLIHYSLIVIMYLFFLTGLLWMKKR